jgi:N-acetyl-anhydromuramyl-L-alanine amidase AmpD
VIEFLTKILEALAPVFASKQAPTAPASPEPKLEDVSPIKLKPVEPAPVAKPKPGQRLDFYPKARLSKYKLKTRGKYAKGWPLGAVTHFSAGRDGAENLLKYASENSFVFMAIQKDGQIYQSPTAPISAWGFHAGESKWKTLFGSVSDDLIGIEITCAGRLTEKDGKLYTWYGAVIPRDNARYTPGRANQLHGWYEKFTPEQEATLIDLLLWLKHQAPEVFSFDHVLGHDEVSGKSGLGYWRKNDPGASLSMTMPELRELLKRKYREVYG